MIPNHIHFIWIQGTKPFGQGEYVSLLSALKNTPYEVFFHTNMTHDEIAIYNPLSISHPRFHVVIEDISLMMHDVKLRPVNIADYWRIKTLHDYGGIYSDLDIIWFSPLPPLTENVKLAASYENPGYKIISNALILSEKEHPRLKELLQEYDNIIKQLAKRGIFDVGQERKTKADFKYHCLLFHATSAFFKLHTDYIYPKRLIMKNGWRRIGRKLLSLGIELNSCVDKIAISGTDDKVNFKDAVGFHYFGSMYSYDQIKQIECLTEKLNNIEKYHDVINASQ